MAIRWIPGSGLQSYAPEEAKKQALAKIGIPSKSSSGRSSASSSNKQSIAKSIAKAAREKAAQEKLEAEKRRILEAQIKAAKTQEEKQNWHELIEKHKEENNYIKNTKPKRRFNRKWS